MKKVKVFIAQGVVEVQTENGNTTKQFESYDSILFAMFSFMTKMVIMGRASYTDMDTFTILDNEGEL